MKQNNEYSEIKKEILEFAVNKFSSNKLKESEINSFSDLTDKYKEVYDIKLSVDRLAMILDDFFVQREEF